MAVVQFIKSGNWNVGEEKMGRQLGVAWHAFGDGFTWDSSDLSNDIAHAAEGWAKATELIMSGETRSSSSTRSTYLGSFGWLPMRARSSSRFATVHRHVNVIVTGRSRRAGLIDVADTVTEIARGQARVPARHPHDAGIDY